MLNDLGDVVLLGRHVMTGVDLDNGGALWSVVVSDQLACAAETEVAIAMNVQCWHLNKGCCLALSLCTRIDPQRRLTWKKAAAYSSELQRWERGEQDLLLLLLLLQPEHHRQREPALGEAHTADDVDIGIGIALPPMVQTPLHCPVDLSHAIVDARVVPAKPAIIRLLPAEYRQHPGSWRALPRAVEEDELEHILQLVANPRHLYVEDGSLRASAMEA